MNNIRDINALTHFYQMARTGAAVNPTNITLLELCNRLQPTFNLLQPIIHITPATIVNELNIHIPLGFDPNNFEIDISKCGDIIDYFMIMTALREDPILHPNNFREVFIEQYANPIPYDDFPPFDQYVSIRENEANIRFFVDVQMSSIVIPPVDDDDDDEISLEDFIYTFNVFMNSHGMPMVSPLNISEFINWQLDSSLNIVVCTELLNMLFIKLYHLTVNQNGNQLRQLFVNHYTNLHVAFPPHGPLPIFFAHNGAIRGVTQESSAWICPICMEDETAGSVFWLACGHKFHVNCIQQLNASPNVNTHFQCPNCRRYSAMNAGNMIGGNPIKPVGPPAAYHYFLRRPIPNYEGKKGRRGSKKCRRSKKCKKSKRIGKK
jgi:hypothetical protein